MDNCDNTIEFENTTIDELDALLEEYTRQISIPYDDFLEDYILASKIYSISFNRKIIGFFGIKDNLITIFYVNSLHFDKAKNIFENIKNKFNAAEAFIPTTDIAALSIVLENYKGIKIQALHFSDTKREVKPPKFGKEYFRIATSEDLHEIENMAGDFLDDYESRIDKKELYVLFDKENMLGIGVLVKNRIMKNCIGTGMFTKDGRREEGIGRSIILHLKDIVYAQGMIPVPGCWYYNTNSRKTLESAGYITKSKLLRIVL